MPKRPPTRILQHRRTKKRKPFQIGLQSFLILGIAWCCFRYFWVVFQALPSSQQVSSDPQRQISYTITRLEARKDARISDSVKQPSPKDSNPMISATDGAKASLLLSSVVTPKKNGIQVAYAISLIKCGDKQSTSAGLTDAALVMRHSIHLTHLQSKYDYKMYAIVHKQAEECGKTLKDAGFEIVLVDQPLDGKKDIQGKYLRDHIHKEWCCGEQEFIKLYAYGLPDPIIVHVDIDFAFFKPMDDLFDAIMYEKDSPEGQAARSRIPLERPEEGFPDKIGAFITRDWPQVMPGRKAMYQAGFLVARRDPTVIDEVIEVIKEGNYTEGFSTQNGWGGLGYGGFVGAMAMQGESAPSSYCRCEFILNEIRTILYRSDGVLL